MTATSEMTHGDREYAFSDRDFEYLRTLVKEKTGINLTPAKRELVYSRLAKRIRQIKLPSFREYCEVLRDNRNDEVSHMVNAITTNLTSFFREGHHFQYLADTLMPELLERNAASRRIRVWSAGCSTGEEPYSLAIAIKNAAPELHWDIKILATDLDTTVLEKARTGVYSEERVAALPDALMRRWFERLNEATGIKVRVASGLKQMITFKQLNLMGPWPMKGPFDAIFCRNVLIYFDKQTQGLLADRFAEMLGPHGRLFLGHSESLYRVSDRFRLIGTTIYQKVA